MNFNASLPSKSTTLSVDLKRTDRPEKQDKTFYWDSDTVIHTGQNRINMTKALSQLSPALKASFKDHLISFTKQGEYAPNSCVTLFACLKTALNVHRTSAFDVEWIEKALTNSSFRRYKKGVLQFLLHWSARDNAAVTQEALYLLSDAAALRQGPRNVLSDDPEKSWLTNEEYESLLSAVWDNYDCGASGTQVTLIKLFSMQYARRPVQIAHLKVGDIRESDGSDSHGLTGRIVNFPGVKDITAEIDFRDSKFEPHPLPDHLWNLYKVQRQEVRALYEHTLKITLTDDQLNDLPLFCDESRIKEARNIIEDHLNFNLLDNFGSKLFHLRKLRITQILTWTENTPTCSYGSAKPKWSLRPKPPISPRTSQVMVISATRMRHTRARQLARQGVPKHMLSHWLGHTSEASLDAYYNDPAEEARQLDEAMGPVLVPLAMAFAGTLIDSEDQASRANDPTSNLEFAHAGELKSVGRCGRHSFCATTSVPIPCYRCKHFEPLVDAPHEQVLKALLQRQTAEEQLLKIGGQRNLLIPIDLSADIRAVENCIARCNARNAQPDRNQ